MSEKFYLTCVSCQKIFKSFYTIKTTNENLIDINLRSVHAAVTSGGGLTSLRSFCSSMDLPPPVHTAPYSKYLKVILKSSAETCDESMNRAAQSLSNNEVLPTEVAVSIDGTWQKCYGLNSLLGATYLLFPFIMVVFLIIQSNVKLVQFVKKIPIPPRSGKRVMGRFVK